MDTIYYQGKDIEELDATELRIVVRELFTIMQKSYQTIKSYQTLYDVFESTMLRVKRKV